MTDDGELRRNASWQQQVLRRIPAIDEVLRDERIRRLINNSGANLVGWVRSAVAQVRSELLNVPASDVDTIFPTSLMTDIIAKTEQIAELETRRAIQHVINATGTLLHTNLGRCPLARRAIERMQMATSYSNIELDLASGKRGKRGARVMELLARLTGAEDALVVNNCAAATMLALAATAAGREVIVSRGQLVEIGGGFRLPEVFRAAGVTLREVGTTNRTYVSDYQTATSDGTGAILRVHRSNFAQIGFVEEPNISDLASLERGNSIPLIEDLGSGCIVSLAAYGLSEPTVGQSVSAGADLTLFSGDKLFGGPQSGIVVGRAQWIARLRSHPMMRAMRVDKVTLAALEATAEIYLDGRATDELPLYQMLGVSCDQLRRRASDIREQLHAFNSIDVRIAESVAFVGGGSLPGRTVPSVCLEFGGVDTEALAQQLRLGQSPVVTRVADGRVVVDLRTVHESELNELTNSLQSALSSMSEQSAR